MCRCYGQQRLYLLFWVLRPAHFSATVFLMLNDCTEAASKYDRYVIVYRKRVQNISQYRIVHLSWFLLWRPFVYVCLDEDKESSHAPLSPTNLLSLALLFISRFINM